MKRIKEWLHDLFRISVRDCAVTLLCMLLASVLCFLLQIISASDAHVPLIFVLAVLVVSRFTDGYLLGFLASAFAVLAVNYIFTYPYFELDFALTGYPLTFVCFFGVSLTTCALTSRLRMSEKARMVGEREKMRANLLRAISHDLRTPLTSIVEALDAGADDYITKPFGTDELLARIRTALRHTRSRAAGDISQGKSLFVAGELTIDYNKRQVQLRGKTIHLTQNEYRVISLLGANAGKVLTYDFILKELWGPASRGDNQALRVHMANIRRKLEENPAEPKYIYTEVGVGYRMVEGDQ